MKSNSLVWLVVAGLLLLGVWYWTNRSAMAPTTAPAGEGEVMMEESEDTTVEEDATVEEDSETMMEGDEATTGDDAMMEKEAAY